MPIEGGRRRAWAGRFSPEFLATPGLTDQAKLLMLTIDSIARMRTCCWPSCARLESATGKCKRTVLRTLGELERSGWIARHSTKGCRGRLGIVMLRRCHPDLPHADTPEKVATARAELMSKLRSVNGGENVTFKGDRNVTQNKDEVWNKGEEGTLAPTMEPGGRPPARRELDARRLRIADAIVRTIPDGD